MMRLRSWPIGAVISIGLMVGLSLFGEAPTLARDLGQVGPVYAIVEKHVPERTVPHNKQKPELELDLQPLQLAYPFPQLQLI